MKVEAFEASLLASVVMIHATWSTRGQLLEWLQEAHTKYRFSMRVSRTF